LQELVKVVKQTIGLDYFSKSSPLFSVQACNIIFHQRLINKMSFLFTGMILMAISTNFAVCRVDHTVLNLQILY
jgi:hypothetical protein